MKECLNCNKIFEIEDENCPICGSSLVNESSEETDEQNAISESICPNCKTVLDDCNAVFCPYCGTKINGDTTENSFKKTVKNDFKKIKENEFVKSVKQDIDNSHSINLIKDKVKSSNKENNKKIFRIAISVLAIFAVIMYCTHIYTCEECDKVYVGKKYSISFWGEQETVCKECYYDYYGF